nr:immunoglobulin heavy chain junction region [Mus musculus]
CARRGNYDYDSAMDYW